MERKSILMTTQPSIKYNNYDVNSDWRLLQGLKEPGDTNASYNVYYNSKDTSQNFSTDINDVSLYDSLQKLYKDQLNTKTAFQGNIADISPDIINSPSKIRQQELEKQAKILSDAGVSGASVQAQNADKTVNNFSGKAEPYKEPSAGKNSTTNPNSVANGNDPNIDIPQNKFSTKTGQPNPAYNPNAQPEASGNITSSSAPGFQFSGTNLSQGSSGEPVTELQQALGIEADGKFGPQTAQAVKNFQLSHGLKADGIVGPHTMEALNKISGGDTGKTVADGVMQNNNKSSGNTSEVPSTGNPEIDSLLKILNNQSPQKSFADVYKEAYTSLGLDSMKTDYEKQVNDQAKLQEEKNKKIQEINNNPWYSEGVRVGKLKELDSEYEGRELIFQNKIKLLETNIDNGRQDAQFLAGGVMDQLNQSQKLSEDVILKAIDIAEARASAESKLQGPSSVQEYEYAVGQGYKGSFSDYQNEDANRKAKASGGGLEGFLSAGQMQSALTQVASQFDNEITVKNYQTIAQTVDAVKNLGITPTDDIRRVYAVAKVFDPNSAVREGEYKTVQDYATSLLQRAGLKANRVFNNDGFLTQEARTFIDNTLKNELSSSTKAYQNVFTGYQKKIDEIKKGKATAGLVDYSAAFNSPSSTSDNSSQFDYLTPQVKTSGSNAYIPRSEWDKVSGTKKDDLLSYFKSLGYNLLIN